MQLKGILHAESPIYRGNARKTLFTRDGDGTQRLASLAGEIAGTAQSLMDAFIGQSRDGRNVGLLHRLWQRLYGQPLPNGLITRADCRLQDRSYPADRFFDLRMGIKLDEDRWAVEANANYKLETLLRNSAFDFTLQVNDALLQRDGNAGKLHYLLQEIVAGRFWFGAGKSKGLGRCRLEMEIPLPQPASPPAPSRNANHLTITCSFDASNPLLVGWNWGKVDKSIPAFTAVEGRVLLQAMRTIPAPIRQRLEMTIGGPILSTGDWKTKLATFLPRAVAIWLREQSTGEAEQWTLPEAALNRLGKDKKYPLSKKVISSVQPLTDKPFATKAEAEEAINNALGGKSNMTNRILNVMVREMQAGHRFNQRAWQEVTVAFNLEPSLGEQLAANIGDESEFTAIISHAMLAVLPELQQQSERQVRLLRSDQWVDGEIENRQEHLRIKEMLRDGRITESQWGNYNQAPDGVSSAAWREFLSGHQRVRYQHMRNPQNLNKSITNDRNFIEFLQNYRQRARQELVQPIHTEFRTGGSARREVAQRYGHPYDTIFMRMMTWKPSAQNETAWEAYIPGSTVKGAFRRRASQVLKTLWGEGERTNRVLDWLFGKQGQVGRVFFSDAYLVDPANTERAWCSMDGIRLDPKTGQPEEGAKMDFLYAYGQQLQFRLRLDLQDVAGGDRDALFVLQHLLQDFKQGDIPLGGQKTSGMGWVEGKVEEVAWFAAGADNVTAQLFPNQTPVQDGLWQTLTLTGEAAARAFTPSAALAQEKGRQSAPPKAQAGHISHRAFGGYCGTLHLEAEILQPTHIQESGEPSYTTRIGQDLINGWDFFSMTSPEAELRDENRLYALPSRTLKGMVRHLYAIASDSRGQSRDLSQLNPADSLFGWVGSGPNEALMGRLVFGIGRFDSPQLAWFKAPVFYGNWRYENGSWRQADAGNAPQVRIADTWRIFPHAPLAPVVQRMSNFMADTATAQYFRAVLPGSRARFTLRFWNLEEEELQRLVWCLALEEGLAHKVGKNRYLGLGSLRLRVLPESHLTDWAERYGAGAADQGRLPFDAAQWSNPDIVHHLEELRRTLTWRGV